MKHSPRKSSIDFDLRQLEIFCKVVEHKSFSKAASAVFLAQASVSERISNLEKIIGAKLLDRLGREVVPTRAGKLLYKHARLLLDMKRTACLAMEDFIGVKQGEIHIGGSTIPGEYILPKYIEQFNNKFPDISVMLTIADTGKIEEDVAGGYLELGVVGSKNSKKNLTYYELWDDELVVVVPAGHSLAKKQKITVEELSKEPFILREKGSGTLKIMENYLQKHESASIESLNIVARFGSSTAVKEGIKAGLGISILSSRALGTELKTGILKALKVKGLEMKRKFYLMKDEKRTASPLCKAIFDFLLTTSSKKL
ncbi:MAG: LysR family transcriptional regulator [Desulfobacterales bacterium]|jgi:DNA-binding transcriptional LysR family regulator|nr:LysR family transcriptional regulator [Desulfobacterales bacterium]MDL2124244.1 LysR family transcriptional regulator [Deltaproteobacteria bacterium]